MNPCTHFARRKVLLAVRVADLRLIQGSLYMCVKEGQIVFFTYSSVVYTYCLWSERVTLLLKSTKCIYCMEPMILWMDTP